MNQSEPLNNNLNLKSLNVLSVAQKRRFFGKQRRDWSSQTTHSPFFFCRNIILGLSIEQFNMIHVIENQEKRKDKPSNNKRKRSSSMVKKSSTDLSSTDLSSLMEMQNSQIVPEHLKSVECEQVDSVVDTVQNDADSESDFDDADCYSDSD